MLSETTKASRFGGGYPKGQSVGVDSTNHQLIKPLNSKGGRVKPRTAVAKTIYPRESNLLASLKAEGRTILG